MATSTGPGKRGPSVLVTDSRERPSVGRKISSSQRANLHNPSLPRDPVPTRLISVDNVLQHASQIPSGQARQSPVRRPAMAPQRRTTGAAGAGARITQQSMPGRSTKVSQKLVLIPETVSEKGEIDDEGNKIGVVVRGDEEEGPLTNDEIEALKMEGGIRGKSYAERLPKAKRTDKVARVTAYCTAQGYKTSATAAFVKEQHVARTKLYDDCLYTVYHLPLLPGTDGFRVRSSPILKNPGGKAVLDEEIERSEQRDYHEGYFEDTDTYGVRGGEDTPVGENEDERRSREEEGRRSREQIRVLEQGRRMDSPNRRAPDATTFAEMFVFSYGVVVFWNFTERQEKDILADIIFSERETAISLVTRPLLEEDFETEEMHFEYSPLVERPRIFNDMITLRSGDHMIKLAMSHAIAQSTKLSFFEEKMSQTMLDAQHVPRHLALTGQLGLSRKEVVKILGRLFKSRVDVNLSSTILDVPNFFWDSEPTLHPLYHAIREYLEIGPRIKVLNERCRVFLELAEILSDSIADTKMSNITWIIIMLIAVSIFVTVAEVGIRFGILSKGKTDGAGAARAVEWAYELKGRNFSRKDFDDRQLRDICGVGVLGEWPAEL